MIKYNNNTINDWYYGTSNLIKVYRNNAIVYYKVSGESPTPEYKVCFAVVDDISQYTDREFEDVYDNATEKWYKLNNLNQYEEYGVYGSGRTITTYEGKLTIDDADDGEDYSTHYLTLVAQTDNVAFTYSTATSSNKLKYSLDSGSTWNELGNNQSTSAINSGEKILFKASGLTVNTERGIGKIIPSASASVEGNIMSLAYGDDFIGQTVIPNNFQFRKLFGGVTSITSAENMALPATTIKKQCYSQMFQACTNLTKTPKVIGSSAMTWSGDYCFSDMFNSCTSLTTVPSGLLPAKNLSSACYWCMFQNCPNLRNTPLLPATTLVSNCYLGMFSECTSLNYIEALFTTAPSSSYMNNWVSGITNSGTFYKNSEATWSTSCGASTYPCGWTVQDYVEPAPIKYEYIYSGGSWVNVGEVSGSTIPDNYVIQFEDQNVKTLCVNNWGGNVVVGELTYGEAKQVTSLGSVFKNNTSIISFNELAYFKGLTALDNGEFAGCRNLTDIVIPNNITTLGYDQANRSTFSGCTNLSGITMISGGESLTMNGTANNGSYYMNSSHQTVPMVFPDRQMTLSNGAFGYYDYLSTVYFQCSTPPTNLANADINNYRKLANVYCPVGSLSAYEAALTGKGKTISEYNFETDSLGLLDKEKEWASKTSSQTIYPVYYSEKTDPLDDLTFNTLAEAQTYAYNNCVYDGMHATIDGDRYYFDSSDENGWVENQHSLPDVPFSVNFNAKNYNSSTKTLLKTSGQLVDVDAVITAGTPTVGDGYLTIASGTRATIEGYSTYFNRDNNNNPNLTIISKQRTDGSNCHMFANRDSNYNWMYRPTSAKLCFHGTRQIDGTNTTTQPVIESVRVNSNKLLTFNNYTDKTSSTYSNFAYGSTNSGKFAIFAGYGTNSGEWFVGDFYWVYMSQNTLTDEQIQQVIDYNENL